MNNFWLTELQKLLGVAALSLLLGWTFNIPYIALVLCLFGYCLWLLYQMQAIAQWVDKGTKIGNAPDIGGAAGVMIGQLHKAAHRNRKRRKRLGKLVSRYQRAATALPDATLVLTNDNAIVWANPACANLLGLNPKRDIGLRIETLLRDPSFSQFLHKKDSQELEIEPLRHPGKTILLRLVPYGENQLLTARDISQRVKLRDERRQFVANVSHELRTPITVIQGYLELLDDEPVPEPLQSALENIRRQSSRMESLVEDLLQLSRLESSAPQDWHFSQINLSYLLSSLVEDVEISHPSRAEHIHLELDASLELNGIESEITSLCTNLLINALNHTPEGTRVHLRWYAQGGQSVLQVSDNGPGVSPEQLHKLTQRFYRTDASRQRERGRAGGTGLGLAIVKYIAERHNAEVVFDSDIGQGLQVTVTFG